MTQELSVQLNSMGLGHRQQLESLPSYSSKTARRKYQSFPKRMFAIFWHVDS